DAEVVETGPEKTPAAAIEETAPIAPAEEFPEGPGAEIEIPDQLAGEMEAVFQEEPPSAKEMITEAAPSAQPVEESAKPATEEKSTPVQEAPRGARILGRIDLRRAARVEPAPTPLARRPVPGAPVAPPVVQTEALRPARDGEAAKPQGPEEKPAKTTRQ